MRWFNRAWIIGAVLLVGSGCAGAVTLSDVSVSPGASETEVVLTFSSSPVFSYGFRHRPSLGLTVKAKAQVSSRQFPRARGGLVKGVTVESEEIDGEAWCLVAIALEQPATARVEEVGNSLRIHLVSASPQARRPLPPSFEDFATSSFRDLQHLKVRRIAVDPGHGGLDPGATHHGVKEKDVVLAVARKLVDLVNRRGDVQAFLTRKGDYFIPLRERPLIANQFRADLFVSLHANAHRDASHRGAEVYFCSEKASDAMAALVAERENRIIHSDEDEVLSDRAVDIQDILFRFERKLYWEDSGRVAHLVLPRLVASLGTVDRGVRSANFSVLRNAKMPALLVEIGFVSHSMEARKLADPTFQQRVAEGILAALEGMMP